MKNLVPRFRSIRSRLLAIVLLALILIVAPTGSAFASHSNEQVKETTESDLSDIPNLERMDRDTFEEHVGDVPKDRNPLLNPDNPKVQIKDKKPGSDKVITTDDLQEDPS